MAFGKEKKRIIEAVAKFAEREMGLRPASILVNLQPDALYVILQGITFPAEEVCAQDEHGQDLLEEYYMRTFDVAKQNLMALLKGILGRPVHSPVLRVDPRSGSGLLHARLGSKDLSGARSRAGRPRK